jgi:hypothetical protein
MPSDLYYEQAPLPEFRKSLPLYALSTLDGVNQQRNRAEAAI